MTDIWKQQLKMGEKNEDPGKVAGRELGGILGRFDKKVNNIKNLGPPATSQPHVFVFHGYTDTAVPKKDHSERFVESAKKWYGDSKLDRITYNNVPDMDHGQDKQWKKNEAPWLEDMLKNVVKIWTTDRDLLEE